MQDYVVIGIIALMLIIFIVIQPALLRMRQRQQMLRFMDAVINQVQNYGNKNEKDHRAARSKSNNRGTLITYVIGIGILLVTYQASQSHEASIPRGPTFSPKKDIQVKKGAILNDKNGEETAGGFTLMDLPRKRGVMEETSPEAASIPISSIKAGKMQSSTLSGFAQQLIALHSKESVVYNLERALKFYPEAPILIIEEKQADGEILFKGVIGKFDDRSKARAAYPDLKHLFKGRFPVNLEGLSID